MRLAITMLSRDRTAITDHHIRGILHEGAIGVDTVATGQIKVDARVDAALTKMTIQGRDIAVAVEQLSQVPQVTSQLFWWYSRILPAFPAEWLTRHEHGSPQCGLAHQPDPAGLLRVREQLHDR